ncbi:hypothetical protein CYLTODRAFT_467386 [Cylindrobasidium torrendii FP15055 ss-10]|uniref:Uncharacterized protein n=1 Tax=Cylindrobasidium torrendii FP15055 ss-10 TaxID=1314674 RepID=A0A0D7B3L1_9AGAR|nr:hypothetical protein CYLTODRAFT_467386 [Cylindrobasidium torrendii FP15055 ss-10]
MMEDGRVRTGTAECLITCITQLFVTKHNLGCAPKDRINIYDWIPPTDAETSPGHLYLVLFFDWPDELITLWGYGDRRSYDVPVADGVITLMNNNPLWISYATALSREKLFNSKKWVTFERKQKPEIRGALQAFDRMVDGWTTANIIETPAEYKAGVHPARIRRLTSKTAGQGKSNDVPDEGDDNAAASTSQAAAQDVRPMAKKKRT